MLVFEVPNIIRVLYEKENALIIHEWLNYDPEGEEKVILDILQKIYDTFLLYPVDKVIVKADQVKGSFSPAIQRYIADVQFPRILANTNARYVVTIQSRETMKQIATQLWQEQFEAGARVILHDVRTEAEARAWLKTITSTQDRKSNS